MKNLVNVFRNFTAMAIMALVILSLVVVTPSPASARLIHQQPNQPKFSTFQVESRFEVADFSGVKNQKKSQTNDGGPVFGAPIVGMPEIEYDRNGNIVVTPEVGAPVITEQAANSVTDTSAVLFAKVNPNGLSTQVVVQLVDNAGGQPGESDPFSIGAGSAPVPISIPVGTLTPGHSYSFRYTAQNSSGTSAANPTNFVTLGGGSGGGDPIVHTKTATSIGQTTARLNGEVDPNGSPTMARFDLRVVGTSAWYSSTSVDVGSSRGQLLQGFVDVSTLQPETTYEFRLVALRGSTVFDGGVLTFRTLPGNPPPAAISISPANATIAIGETISFVVTNITSGQNITSSATFALSNAGVLTPLGGAMFRGDGGGTTVVTASYAGASAQATVTVQAQQGTPPAVFGLSVTNVTANSATLSGSIVPNTAEATTYHFRYGVNLELQTSEQSLQYSAPGSTVYVSSTVTNLLPNTTYRFELVATNRFGTTAQPGNSFLTTSGGGSTTITVVKSFYYTTTGKLKVEALAPLDSQLRVLELGDSGFMQVKKGRFIKKSNLLTTKPDSVTVRAKDGSQVTVHVDAR